MCVLLLSVKSKKRTLLLREHLRRYTIVRVVKMIFFDTKK